LIKTLNLNLSSLNALIPQSKTFIHKLMYLFCQPSLFCKLIWHGWRSIKYRSLFSICNYHKLVETFHIVSKCNTAIYFSWSLTQALAQPIQLFWPLVTFSIASGDSLTDSDLQPFIETEQDRTRHSFIHKNYFYQSSYYS